jgi:hypothetical protein
MVTRIKSPLLCQLSYRPKITKLFGKSRAVLARWSAIVSPVYPIGSSRATAPDEDVLEPLRRWGCP